MQIASDEIASLKNQCELNTDLEAQSCQVELENVLNECGFNNNLLKPIGNVAISLIRRVENAREIHACAGMSTNFGFLTTRSGMLDPEVLDENDFAISWCIG